MRHLPAEPLINDCVATVWCACYTTGTTAQPQVLGSKFQDSHGAIMLIAVIAFVGR